MHIEHSFRSHFLLIDPLRFLPSAIMFCFESWERSFLISSSYEVWRTKNEFLSSIVVGSFNIQLIEKLIRLRRKPKEMASSKRKEGATVSQREKLVAAEQRRNLETLKRKTKATKYLEHWEKNRAKYIEFERMNKEDEVMAMEAEE